jgi:uncharacterized hydrophobic protein (TIGR00271 family)
VLEISLPRRSFYVMVAISTTIAAYGLLANSAAVVIGAMLVAPLKGPIFGIALALTVGNNRFLRSAASAETLGVALSVALGAAIGSAPLSLGFGSEILARTQPTLYDIIVALASGLAGAYALLDERISPALPGVAIATALVPPLTTCGLCLASARWEWALGAFLLFGANFLSIELAAALVFSLFGMARVEAQPTAALGYVLRRFWLSLALLAVVAVMMTQTLLGLIAERRLSSTIEKTLSQELRSSVGAALSGFRTEKRGAGLEVVATVLTPQEFEPAQVARIEEALRRQVRSEIHLIVRSLLSRDADRSGVVFLAQDERERRVEVAEQTQFLTTASRVLGERLARIPGTRIVEVRREENDGRAGVMAVVRAPEAIGPAAVADAEAALRQALGEPVRLTVRSVPVQEATAREVLYRKQEEPVRRWTEAARRAERRLKAALRNQVRRQSRAADLVEFRYARRNGRLIVLATVQAPGLLTFTQVRRIERALRRYVHPETDLVVRNVIRADVTSRGYVPPREEGRLVSPAPGRGLP